MQSPGRIWEIDFIRGLAIILMILFHLVFDLKEFYAVNINYSSGGWFYVGKIAAILFIFICGISAGLSAGSTRHGLKILGWGIMLTLVTYLYTPVLYIRFGILHLLGLSLISYSPISRIKTPAIVAAGLAILAGGYLLPGLKVSTSWLLILGATPPDFASLDYYPLIPWYGIFLLGAAAGKQAYRNKTSLLPVSIQPGFINYLGRHSLLVYLIHQPVLLLLLKLLHPLFSRL